jgi:hypothetical protein
VFAKLPTEETSVGVGIVEAVGEVVRVVDTGAEVVNDVGAILEVVVGGSEAVGVVTGLGVVDGVDDDEGPRHSLSPLV